jgi:hypothetical protein
MRLVKGLYQSLWVAGLFGLIRGQVRSYDLVHNGAWYNGLGQRIGWGSLSPEDLLSIAGGLQSDEQFYVLPEADRADELGPPELASKARYLVERGAITVFREADRDCLLEAYKYENDVNIVLWCELAREK